MRQRGASDGLDQTFTTGCTEPSATTNPASPVGITKATLKGTVNANGFSTTMTFEYGTSTSYGSTAIATPGTVTGSSNTSVSANITGLTPDQIYHYRVKAVNCGGTTNGQDQIFTTVPAEVTSYGFTALPGGFITMVIGSQFIDHGSSGSYWSGTEYDAVYANYLRMHYNSSAIEQGHFFKWMGMSVRCIKD